VDRTGKLPGLAADDHGGGARPTDPLVQVRPDGKPARPNAAEKRTPAAQPRSGSCQLGDPESFRSPKARKRPSNIGDDGNELRHDMQVIIDVPADWSLPAPACQEILDVISAIARRTSGTGDERVAR